MENENIKVRRDETNKIVLFVIGVLIGAVISSAAFLISVNTLGVGSSAGGSSQQGGQGGTPPEMPSGESRQNGQGETPPEKPDES